MKLVSVLSVLVLVSVAQTTFAQSDDCTDFNTAKSRAVEFLREIVVVQNGLRYAGFNFNPEDTHVYADGLTQDSRTYDVHYATRQNQNIKGEVSIVCDRSKNEMYLTDKDGSILHERQISEQYKNIRYMYLSRRK